MAEGGCMCGYVRYRMTSDPICVNCCHCRDCQRLSGSAFALNAMIETDRVELIGEGDPDAGRSGEQMAACPRCETVLWGYHRMFGRGVRFVRAGTLDMSEPMRPDAHFFTRSKHPWVTVPDGVPAFETLPGPGDPPLWTAAMQARIAALPAG
jgi:hypothetical protein